MAFGWYSRLKESMAGAVFGILLFLVAFPALFFNEGRAVKRAQDLEFGADAVTSIASDRSDGKNNGKLVHLTGSATPIEKPADAALGVTADALRISRKVEMFQWERTKSGKSTTTEGADGKTKSHSYQMRWKDRLIDSSEFSGGHENPKSMPFETSSFAAKGVKLGAFRLGDALVKQLKADTKLEVTKAKLPAGAVVSAGGIYIGDPATESVGDVRITYTMAPAGPLTVVGEQSGPLIGAFTDDELNGEIALVARGEKTAKEMFKSAQDSNSFLTWALRFVGFMLMFFGLRLAASPLSALASIIPFAGKAVGFGTAIVAAFLAAGASTVTIAIAWLFYRPLLAIGLFVVAGASVAGAIALSRKFSD